MNEYLYFWAIVGPVVGFLAALLAVMAWVFS